MIDRSTLFRSDGVGFARELQSTIQAVADLEVPSAWVEEGSAHPTDTCRIKTCQVVSDLFEAYHLIPHRVGASRIGGILALYRYDGSDLELELEVDNELDVVGVLSTDKEVIDSAELSGPDEWRDFVRRFTATAAQSPRLPE